LVFCGALALVARSSALAAVSSHNPLPDTPVASQPCTGPACDSAEILSDTKGVDFGPYIKQVLKITQDTWQPLIPSRAKDPVRKSRTAVITFIILPNGSLQAHAMQLAVRSGDVNLDRAAWEAIEDTHYPPLPQQFHNPSLRLRMTFLYNVH
jgi:TonB family protein